DPGSVEHLESFNPVALPTLPQLLQARELPLLRCDDQLTDVAIFDPLGVAVPPNGTPAFDAQLCLEGAGRVVDSGVDHAAVPARLVPVECVLLFDSGDSQLRVAERQFARRGKSEDPAADDCDVVDHAPAFTPLSRS